MTKQERADAVVEILRSEYPKAPCALDFVGPWQLLVATVLSAQCTDERVNSVTPAMFRRWPDAAALAEAPIAEIESVIRATGLYRNKARSLREAARIVAADHGGRVPADLDELVRLPSVGRKTAKVVLGEGFGISAGVTVDTHVRRLAQRIGLTRQQDPERIASELERLVPRPEWIRLSMRLILHGRRVCMARRPKCEDCVLAPVCKRVGVTERVGG